MRINEPEKLFFTSDTHFGHANILRNANRPFKSIEEHDETLIENWNATVSESDIVCHLGDFCWGNSKDEAESLIKRLNGYIFLVYGNHDSAAKKIKNGLTYLGGYLELEVKDPDLEPHRQLIVLSHYAFKVWNKKHYGSWQLYGHSHGTLPEEDFSKQMDVGVDAVAKLLSDYRPISYSEVKAVMNKRTFRRVDHHGSV